MRDRDCPRCGLELGRDGKCPGQNDECELVKGLHARIAELEQIIRQSEIARKECESKIRATTDNPLLIDLYMIVSGFIGDNVGRVEKALRELQALREAKP